MPVKTGSEPCVPVMGVTVPASLPTHPQPAGHYCESVWLCLASIPLTLIMFDMTENPLCPPIPPPQESPANALPMYYCVIYPGKKTDSVVLKQEEETGGRSQLYLALLQL